MNVGPGMDVRCRSAVPVATAKLEAAITACQRRGGRVTDLRRRVLAGLCRAGRAVGAYELRDRIAVEGQRPVPLPSVYRSLDFLCRYGVAVRIESRNAFLLTTRLGLEAPRVLLLCEHCEQVQEVASDACERLLEEAAAGVGFDVEHRVIELVGTCVDCSGRARR